MGETALGGRLALLPVEALGARPRALHDRLVDGRLAKSSPFRSRTEGGELIGPFNACLYAPTIGAGFIDFHEAEERGTPLSPRAREVVILSVGAVWGAAYELYAHRALASRLGLDAEVVAALAAGEPCAALSEKELALQRFTLELTGDRQVGDATYKAAQHAYGSEGLVAATFLASAYTGTCMVLNAFAVPAPDS